MTLIYDIIALQTDNIPIKAMQLGIFSSNLDYMYEA